MSGEAPAPAVTAGRRLRLGIQGSRLRLQAMSFAGADLSDADLDSAQADLTVFGRATMQRATLRRLQSDGFLFFEDADLRDAVLDGAELRQVDFGRANLSGAALSGADLSGADLSQVTRDDRTVVEHAQTDDYTKGMWERAVRMVAEIRGDHESEWAAMGQVAALLG